MSQLCQRQEDGDRILFKCVLARYVWCCVREILSWDRGPNSLVFMEGDVLCQRQLDFLFGGYLLVFMGTRSVEKLVVESVTQRFRHKGKMLKRTSGRNHHRLALLGGISNASEVDPG